MCMKCGNDIFCYCGQQTTEDEVRVERVVMPINLGPGKRHERTIPFSMLNEEWADRNHGQTLKRLAERGGLGPCEAIAIMDRRKWMAMPDKAALEILLRRIDAASEA